MGGDVRFNISHPIRSNVYTGYLSCFFLAHSFDLNILMAGLTQQIFVWMLTRSLIALKNLCRRIHNNEESVSYF